MAAIWGKVYGSLHSSIKWQRSSSEARALWATAMSWSIDQGTDGVVPSDVLRFLGGTKRAANKLVEVGLWEFHPEGWKFHDWLDHNVSDQQIQDQRRSTRERVQRHRDRQRNGVTNSVSNTSPVTPSNTARTEQNRTEEEGGSSQGHQSAPKDEPPRLETSIPSHVIPASWGPTTRHKAYAMEHGLRIAREVEKFRANALSTRKARIDWDAEFDGWMARSADMAEGRTEVAAEKRPGSSVWEKTTGGTA